MAVAIRELTARCAYSDLTRRFADKGRRGKLVNCPQCSCGYLLYFGDVLDEQEATERLQQALPKCCPEHKGWLAFDEEPPVSDAEHRRMMQEAIERLQRDVDAEHEAAQSNSGHNRERLILSAAQKQGEINELKQAV